MRVPCVVLTYSYQDQVSRPTPTVLQSSIITMSNLLVIFGVNGQQGSSVANTVLSTPALSKQYRIQGVTRDANSASAKGWIKRGVSIVGADMNDRAALKRALTSAHTVYAMTNSPMDNTKKHIEIEQGRNIIDAAIEAGVKHFIFSSTPSASEITNGRYTEVGHFDAKYEVEKYLKTTTMPYTIYSPSAFMQNFLGPFRPVPTGPDHFALMQFISGDAKIPLIDISHDTGKFVGHVLENPEAFYSKTIAGAGGIYTFNELATIATKVSGKNVTFKQVPEDAWRSKVPAQMQEEMVQMMKMFEENGYYGSETARIVSEGQKGVSDLVTFEKFVDENKAALGLA